MDARLRSAGRAREARRERRAPQAGRTADCRDERPWLPPATDAWRTGHAEAMRPWSNFPTHVEDGILRSKMRARAAGVAITLALAGLAARAQQASSPTRYHLLPPYTDPNFPKEPVPPADKNYWIP